MGSLVSAPIWSRVAACPVGELRERAAELALQASDVGAVADTLEPFQHQRRFLAVLPDLFDWRLRERNRPTQRLRQDLRRLRHRSYVTGEIDLAAVHIDLPDEKHLIIDSKVSLIAYERLVNCETEEERKLFSKAHVESIRSHVAGLSAKNYHDLYQINSPDFVLLFIPIESSFSFAVQIDAELFSDAWDKRVVIVSPSTLLATLRTIASIWKQERQNRNVLEIARLSGAMYDKFVGFVGDMESIGKNIKQSLGAYENAINKLTEGNGNLTRTAEKIKSLGAKANKQLDQKYLDQDDVKQIEDEA